METDFRDYKKEHVKQIVRDMVNKGFDDKLQYIELDNFTYKGDNMYLRTKYGVAMFEFDEYGEVIVAEYVSVSPENESYYENKFTCTCC